MIWGKEKADFQGFTLSLGTLDKLNSFVVHDNFTLLHQLSKIKPVKKLYIFLKGKSSLKSHSFTGSGQCNNTTRILSPKLVDS